RRTGHLDAVAERADVVDQLHCQGPLALVGATMHRLGIEAGDGLRGDELLLQRQADGVRQTGLDHPSSALVDVVAGAPRRALPAVTQVAGFLPDLLRHIFTRWRSRGLPVGALLDKLDDGLHGEIVLFVLLLRLSRIAPADFPRPLGRGALLYAHVLQRVLTAE